ncbi:MAG: class I adenylate-forming enzyme family protein [Woeseiaceae bacterium]
MNLANVVRINASNQGQKSAILYQDRCISYADLWRAIESLAAFLRDEGVVRGDRVGLSMKDHPLHLIAHFSVARLGAIIVPIDHRWTENEKKTAAGAFRTKLVLTDGDDIDGIASATLDESVLQTRREELPDIDDFEGNDVDVLISLSSGSTGKPKGSLVTHRNLYERFVSQWAAIGYDARDCFAILTPLFFGAGRSFAMSLLAVGGTVRLAPPPLKPPEIIEVLRSDEVTATFLPPTLLRRLFEFHSTGNPPLLANLDYLIVSGEPLYADEALEVLTAICPNLYSYYASSEGGGISVLPACDFRKFAATVGKPTFRTDVQIVDEQDEELGMSTVGRLRYRGPGVATRTIDSDGIEQDAGVGGWFYPGDLAERLPSGHIALRGRDKDVIIRGGVNIYPAEIEAVLLTHGDIVEAAVVGKDDSDRGQVVSAFLASTKRPSAEDLGAWCRSMLAPYKVPEEFHVMDSLPKRASGKVDKKALQSL